MIRAVIRPRGAKATLMSTVTVDAVIDVLPVHEVRGTLELIVVAALDLKLDFGGVPNFNFGGSDAADPAEGHGCGDGEVGEGVFHTMVCFVVCFD